MNLRTIEYKSLLVYCRRYLLVPFIFKCLLLFILNTLNDIYVSAFLDEITNIIFTFVVVYIMFDVVEEHAYLFMRNKRSFFIKRIVLGYLFTLSSGLIVLLIYTFMVLLSSISTKISIVAIVVYFYLRVSESEFYSLLSGILFFSDLFYVILLVMCMNLVSLIIYVRKDMQ